MEESQQAGRPGYRVIQLVWNTGQGYRNEAVGNFDALVTHHPNSNRGARIEHGIVVGGEAGRVHGVIGGEIQELEVVRAGRDFGLGPNQVLLKKDFILENPVFPTGPESRAVDVPSPIAGVVGLVDTRSGRVDVLDREGGEVIMRVRHMAPIHVKPGDPIEYGQALGVQGRQATAAIHVHMEVDTRYYQQYESYMGDLASGRLDIDVERRGRGIDAPTLEDDGVLRIGEASPVIVQVQQTLNSHGYRTPDGMPLPEDGVYRFSMQPAVIRYQEANGLAATGDLDPATLQRMFPRIFPPEVNREGDDVWPTYLEMGAPLSNNEPLYRQAVKAMEALSSTHDEEEQGRIAAGAACLAKAQGLSRIDHILFSCERGVVRKGESLFVIQGSLDDPAHWRAQMKTEDALAQSVDQWMDKLRTLNTQDERMQREPEALHRDTAVAAHHRIG